MQRVNIKAVIQRGRVIAEGGNMGLATGYMGDTEWVDHAVVVASELDALVAERDAYRAALEALVGARQHCTNCDAIAVLESCDWNGDHVYGCDACGGLPEMSDAKQVRAALALLGAHEGKVK